MTKSFLFCLGIVFGCFLFPQFAWSVEEKSFTGAELELKNYLEDLFVESKKVNSEDTQEKKRARDKIMASLDWDKVSENCWTFITVPRGRDDS